MGQTGSKQEIKVKCEIHAKGYVYVRYVKEGISKWYDGEKMNAYKNTNVVFLKFVKEPEKLNQEFVID